ncbi:MAG: hypothetical protein WB579_24645 [Bryobacteraceae bacterium]
MQYAAYKHVVSKDDIIFFPHVDSCTAIAILCADGVMVGGHVPMGWGDGDDDYTDASYKLNARRMVREMLAALQSMRKETGTNADVNILITFGDSRTFQDIRSELTGGGVTIVGDLQWENLLPTGGDLKLSGPKQEVFAYDYTTKLCVGNFNFSSIKGVKRKTSINQSPLFFVARKMADWFRKDVTGASLEQTFDKEYLKTCPADANKTPSEGLAEWFKGVRKTLGPCKSFDATTGNMMEGTVTFSFAGAMKVVATLKLKRADPSNLISKFVHQISGPPKF